MADSKRIFITGASGFVGSEICKVLIRSGYRVTALLRPGSNLHYPLSQDERITIHRGDATDPESLKNSLMGHHAVIHLVGIIREIPEKGITFEKLHILATKNMVAAAKEAGVKRFLHMSALGVSKNAYTEYFRTKWVAEEYVRNQDLDYTVFRPSIIFGSGDDFTNMIAHMIRRYRSFPLIGGGRSKVQPVAVEDVAEIFARAIDKMSTYGKVYEVGGPEQFEFRDMVRMIADVIRVRVFTPVVPANIMKPIVKGFTQQSWFPITVDQLDMLLMDNTTESTEAFRDTGVVPHFFRDGIAKYLIDK